MTDNNYNFLYGDEITVLNLRKLYESCGFRKYRVGKFESYDFYAKNKDFLVGNRIITFSDLNGKLMALKPDVTLSIIKSADNAEKSRHKVYYTENVYRESKDIHEFKEIFQVGLEVMGKIDMFETAEITILAIKSLLEIDSDAILDISHMGYTEGLLDCLSDDSSLRNEILNLLSQKNSHDFAKIASEHSLPKNPVNTALELMKIHTDNCDILKNAEDNALNTKMQEAAKELQSLYTIIENAGLSSHVKIDLSVSKDPGYYNGILMQGYVNGIPRAVLSGGRYDMLMSKMGSDGTHAMGFAIYFDALDRKLHNRQKNSVDAYIIYNENSDINTMFTLIHELDSTGKTYSAVNELPDDYMDEKIYRINGDKIEEDAL